ncbi:unnamed protein product, partial [Musa acuminata subsp. malaccensis]
ITALLCSVSPVCFLRQSSLFLSLFVLLTMVALSSPVAASPAAFLKALSLSTNGRRQFYVRAGGTSGGDGKAMITKERNGWKIC